MNKHLQQRIETLFQQYEQLTLSSCGAAGPQISTVPYQLHDGDLILFIPHSSDHLFNLEAQPMLALLTPAWTMQGEARLSPEIHPPQSWQVAIRIAPLRLHILSEDGQQAIETIDF